MDIEKFIKHLERDYKIKIPSNEHYEYYLDTLRKSKEYDWLTNTQLSLEVALSTFDDFSGHRKQMFSRVVSHLKEFGDKVLQTSENQFVEDKIKKLSQYKTVIGQNNNIKYKYYISFDIVEANWSVIRAVTGIQMNYQEWIKHLGGHEFIAKSKQWRQAVVNQPESKCKANQRIQQAYTVSLYEHIRDVTVYAPQVVNMTHDELIMGFNVFPKDVYNEVFERFSKFVVNENIKYKPTIYSLNEFESFDELIKVKTVFNEDGSVKFKKLVEYNGKHFYFNFKTHILREPLSKLDLLYKENGFVYSRVIPNLELIEDVDKFDCISIAEIYEHLSDEDRMDDLFGLFDKDDKSFVANYFKFDEDFEHSDIVEYIIDEKDLLGNDLQEKIAEAFEDYMPSKIDDDDDNEFEDLFKVETLYDEIKIEILQKMYKQWNLAKLEYISNNMNLT